MKPQATWEMRLLNKSEEEEYAGASDNRVERIMA